MSHDKSVEMSIFSLSIVMRVKVLGTFSLLLTPLTYISIVFSS